MTGFGGSQGPWEVCELPLLGGGLTQHCPCPPHSQASGGLPQCPLAAVALPGSLLPQ